jgi:endonuclease YncB( thermonuclease family)
MRNSLLGLVIAVIAALMLAPAASAKFGPCLAGVSGSPKCTVWEARVGVVDDGDTVQARVKKAGKFGKRQSVRLNGVQAMEIHNYGHGAKRSGDCHSLEASKRLARLIGGEMVRLSAQKASSTTTGEGGRTRARRNIAVKMGGKWRDVGSMMIAEGWGLPFGNGNEWASNGTYSKLAQTAAAKRKNLWNPSGCGVGPAPTAALDLKLKWDADGGPGGVPDEQNINGEWVRITNAGATPVSLGNWWLRDSHFRGPRAGDFKGRGYKFPSNTVIPALSSIQVHVGRGSNSARDLYWGLGETIFENASEDKKKAGDGAYLFDPKGNLRFYSMYPCRAGNCTDPLAGKVQVTARYQGVEYEWAYIKNTSNAPISLDQYELESSPWFYEFNVGDVVQPGRTLVLFMDDHKRLVPPRNGAPAIVPTRAGLLPFGDTQANGFRAWNNSNAPLLSDNKDVITLRNPAGSPVACAAWGGMRCPNI